MPRTIIITGASSGVGLAAAVLLAAQGDEVVVVGRDPQRLRAAVDQVRAAGGREPAWFRTDFESFAEVRLLAARLRDAYPRIDVLANNAGGMVGGYRTTVDGFEATLQSNHLAPFLLTHLLHDRLSGGRVVNTSSAAHRRSTVDPDDLVGSPKRYSAFPAYGAAKAANILFTAEAARRWPEVFSVAFHPGLVRTNFGTGRVTRFFYRHMPLLVPPEKAGALLVWLATTPATDLTNGGYYVGRELRRPQSTATGADLAARLWESSRKATSGAAHPE